MLTFIEYIFKQGRVRECLVNLLTTCGQRVGLPKSPSVSLFLNLFLEEQSVSNTKVQISFINYICNNTFFCCNYLLI